MLLQKKEPGSDTRESWDLSTKSGFYAWPRVTSPGGLKVLIAEEDGSCGSETRNIVYREVLDAIRE
jgi:hypothetical protein